jgi:formate hydrogenlyase subunit 5
VIALAERRCEPERLALEVAHEGRRLMMLFADDAREISALLAGDRGRVTRVHATLAQPSFPSVTAHVPAGHWFEREIHDLHAIVPVGHPRLEPLLRHDEHGELSHRGHERLQGGGVFLIPYGPVRSGIFETAQYLVQTGGEDVAYCAQRLFFKRRGAERRIREVPLALAVLVAERVSGTSSVAHALAFSHAVEALAQIEPPLRAQAIRRALAEIERLYNHVEVTVRECEDASLTVAQAQFAALKERLHRLAADTVGNRFLRGVIVPGGVRAELGATAADRIRAELADWRRDVSSALGVLLRTDSFLDRLVSAGPLCERDAREFACVGPVARGSGVDIDARRDLPYDGYHDVAVATHAGGDAMARMEVRFREIEVSLDLISQALAGIDAGATLAVESPGFVNEQALGAAESARGEVLYWLAAEAPDRLRFCKLRAASFVNYGVFNRLFDAQVLTDFSFIEHSLGLSPAGCDA